MISFISFICYFKKISLTVDAYVIDFKLSFCNSSIKIIKVLIHLHPTNMLCYIFITQLKVFSNSPVISSLTSGLYRKTLLNFQIFGTFLAIILLLISDLIQSRSDYFSSFKFIENCFIAQCILSVLVTVLGDCSSLLYFC